MRKQITVGEDSLGMAAKSVYVACQLKGENLTLKEIVTVVGTSAVNIENRKREFMETFDLREV